MSYIATIVDFINEQLKENLFNCDLYNNQKIVALAQGLPRTNGEKIEIVPSYIDHEGEATYVGPDDDYDLMIYHRLTALTVGKATLKTYGDNKPMDANIARISLVVFARRDQLHVSNDELAISIQAACPQAATKALLQQLQFKAANINISEIVLNDLQVFQEEFQNVQFFLKPEQYLFKVNYTIESAFLKECFTNNCD